MRYYLYFQDCGTCILLKLPAKHKYNIKIIKYNDNLWITNILVTTDIRLTWISKSSRLFFLITIKIPKSNCVSKTKKCNTLIKFKYKFTKNYIWTFYLVLNAGWTSWGFLRSDQKNNIRSNNGSISATWSLHPSGNIRNKPPFS